jgi:hypothetical protein
MRSLKLKASGEQRKHGKSQLILPGGFTYGKIHENTPSFSGTPSF